MNSLLVIMSVFLISCNGTVSFSFPQEEEPNERPLDPYIWVNLNRQKTYFPLPEETRLTSKGTPSLISYQAVKGPSPILLDIELDFVEPQKDPGPHSPLATDLALAYVPLIDKAPSLYVQNNRYEEPFPELSVEERVVFLEPKLSSSRIQKLEALDKPLSLEPLTVTAQKPELIQTFPKGSSSQGVLAKNPLKEDQKKPLSSSLELEFKATVKDLKPVFIPLPLDIIFVIDTSSSMKPFLLSFKDKFADFLSHFHPLNWQLMVTDADHGDTWLVLSNLKAAKGEAFLLEREGKLLEIRYLNRFVPHYENVFLSSISLHRGGEYKKKGVNGSENINPCDLPPYCQSYKEQPLKSLKSALIKNQDFFREEANLAVILMSNSPEVGPNATGQITTPEEVIQTFKAIHGDHKRFETYGLVIREEDQECLRKSQRAKFFSQVGVSNEIIALSQRTGGEIFSLCAPDYQDLAMSIVDSFLHPP